MMKSVKVFPEGPFRVVYRRGHRNLKQLLAPSRINNIDQQAQAKRVQQEGMCIKCEECGSNPKDRKRGINLFSKEASTIVAYLKRNNNTLRAIIPERNLKSGRLLTVGVKTLLGKLQKMNSARSGTYYGFPETHIKSHFSHSQEETNLWYC